MSLLRYLLVFFVLSGVIVAVQIAWMFKWVILLGIILYCVYQVRRLFKRKGR